MDLARRIAHGISITVFVFALAVFAQHRDEQGNASGWESICAIGCIAAGVAAGTRK